MWMLDVNVNMDPLEMKGLLWKLIPRVWVALTMLHYEFRLVFQGNAHCDTRRGGPSWLSSQGWTASGCHAKHQRCGWDLNGSCWVRNTSLLSFSSQASVYRGSAPRKVIFSTVERERLSLCTSQPWSLRSLQSLHSLRYQVEQRVNKKGVVDR